MTKDSTTSIKHISECFIKPEYKPNGLDSGQPIDEIHLTPWDLSLLSLNYNQKGLLYSKPQNLSIPKLIHSLKNSLSLTLTHFYPLTARFGSRVDPNLNRTVFFIDCRREAGPGVRFIHAAIDDVTISDILTPTEVPPVVKTLFDHNDWRVVNYDGRFRPLLTVQVTELVDGVFIGCSINHVVADGTSLWHFWNVWSKIHRANGEPVSVSLLPSHARWFPKGCELPLALPFNHPHEFIHPYKPPSQLIDGVFHITSESMAKLKQKANKESKGNNISSFQALAALIWRSIARAKGLEPNKVTKCMLAANNRQRIHPNLPQGYFGNSVQTIDKTITVYELLGHNLGWVAWQLHQSIVHHTDKKVRSHLRQWIESPFVVDIGKAVNSNSIKTGSSPRFDVYGNEFAGLGKPIAIRSGFANRFDGKVNTHPGRQGKGSVDLEISLMPQSMEYLKFDPEFMVFVSSPK